MRTVPELLRRCADAYGEQSWLRTDDTQISFAAAACRIGGMAAVLRDRGVGRGEVVVLTARNEPAYLLSLLAVTALGAVAVPTSPKSPTAELAGLLGQLRNNGNRILVITDADLAEPVQRAADQAATTVSIVDVAELGACAPAELPIGAPAEDDVAVMIQTSGTTGRSKLVMQTHRAYVLSGEGFPYWLQLGTDERLMTALPLFHTNALAYSTMGSLVRGAGLVLLPRFSASGFLDSARRHGATSFNAVGGMLELLMAQPVRPDDADNPLRTCYSAPAPRKEEHLAIEERFGIRLICGYGMSESLYGMIWRPGTRPYGTLGSPRQHPELGEINAVRVVDDNGSDVAPGVSGELLLSNPTLTPGYYGMPEETATALRDGWLHTGDLVTVNTDGTYTFVARKKEVIRRRGENLAPAEVEQIVSGHPAVLECAVIGVPAGLSEEEVKAYVKRAPGADVPATELRDWVAARLATFKVPRFWQFVSDIPHTATGRVAKHRLPGAEHGEEDLAPHPRQEHGR